MSAPSQINSVGGAESDGRPSGSLSDGESHHTRSSGDQQRTPGKLSTTTTTTTGTTGSFGAADLMSVDSMGLRSGVPVSPPTTVTSGSSAGSARAGLAMAMPVFGGPCLEGPLGAPLVDAGAVALSRVVPTVPIPPAQAAALLSAAALAGVEAADVWSALQSTALSPNTSVADGRPDECQLPAFSLWSAQPHISGSGPPIDTPQACTRSLATPVTNASLGPFQSAALSDGLPRPPLVAPARLFTLRPRPSASVSRSGNVPTPLVWPGLVGTSSTDTFDVLDDADTADLPQAAAALSLPAQPAVTAPAHRSSRSAATSSSNPPSAADGNAAPPHEDHHSWPRCHPMPHPLDSAGANDPYI